MPFTVTYGGQVAQRSFILKRYMYFALCRCLKWLGGAWCCCVYFLCILTAAYHEDEHVKLVFESCVLFFFSLGCYNLVWFDQAFQVKWFFSEPFFFRIYFFLFFFWKGLVNYLILEAETALSVLYIRRPNASRAFYIQLMHKGNIRANVPSVL